MRTIYTEARDGSDNGPGVQVRVAKEEYRRGSPCGWNILHTDKGVFKRPDTYWHYSPYGWRKVGAS